MPQAFAWLHLPDTPMAGRLRAALMAADILPQVLHADTGAWQRQLEPLAQGAPGAVVFDVTADPMVPGRPLERAVRTIPESVRRRTWLTRFGGGHVSAADRDWVQALGFAGLLADLGHGAAGADLQAWVAAVAGHCAVAPPTAATLTRFVQVMRPASAATDARGLVHALTGQNPEAVAALWLNDLPVADRRYHLRTWPRCLLGSEAVGHITRLHDLGRGDATALGQAMGALGLLSHVTQEHPFQDADLFYRLAWSPGADAVPLEAVYAHLRDPDVLPARTRSHLGHDYAESWVGRDAVDRVVERWSVDRIDAWIVLQRLMAWGCFDHVLAARPFGDGEYFFRWRPGP